jgi:hypothetical protein
MNERIEKLAEQANSQHDNFFDLNYKELDVFLEKFAELIVRECADICINENVSNLDLKVIHESGKFTVQDLATKSCGENLAKRIKEHFGVKE